MSLGISNVEKEKFKEKGQKDLKKITWAFPTDNMNLLVRFCNLVK